MDTYFVFIEVNTGQDDIEGQKHTNAIEEECQIDGITLVLWHFSWIAWARGLVGEAHWMELSVAFLFLCC